MIQLFTASGTIMAGIDEALMEPQKHMHVLSKVEYVSVSGLDLMKAVNILSKTQPHVKDMLILNHFIFNGTDARLLVMNWY